MRMTHTFVRVAGCMMERPTEKHWGYDLTKRTGVRSGVLYPLLERMLDEGWVEDGWENPNEIPDRRPPRRYYTLTGEGQAHFAAILADAHKEPRFAPHLLPRPA
jgi:PadR family transcriptional regulator PadR